MLFLVLISCLLHKTSLTGVVDSISDDKCMIEVPSGDIIAVESRLCLRAKEGEKVLFYIK